MSSNSHTDWRDGFASFWGQSAQQQIDAGRRADPGGKNKISADVWDVIWGRDSSELTGALRTKTQDDLRTKYKAVIEAKGGNYADGMSAGQLEKELHRVTKLQSNRDFTDSPAGQQLAHDRATQNQQMAQQTELMRGQLGIATQQMQNQSAALFAQMKDNSENRSFDRQEGNANRMLSLQLANINADVADKRLQYDRETRRMDRRDRHIATLMSGIGQLGGAFSV